MSIGLYNRKKTVVQLRSCHGLHTYMGLEISQIFKIKKTMV